MLIIGGVALYKFAILHYWYYNNNSMASKLPIKKCMRKIAVQLKSHRESEIARN